MIDERERAVVEFWQRGHLSQSTIQVYLGWVRRFRTYCLRRELVETDQLCLVGVRRFTRAYTGPRLLDNRITRSTCETARNAIHGWACALRALGETVPAWQSQTKTQPLSPLLNEYREYRRAHNGVAESSLVRDLDVAQRFHQHLRDRRRTIHTARLVDLDASLTIRVGKAQRADVLPLPSITGKAIAEYLRKARPVTESRAIFVRHRAPLDVPVNTSVIRSVVRQAATRSGLTDRLHGPHRLRHSAATRMPHSGATLKEIADILRHKSLDTTAIYAKVDVPRLAAIAQPWPGGAA